jgi:hypothetical protein
MLECLICTDLTMYMSSCLEGATTAFPLLTTSDRSISANDSWVEENGIYQKWVTLRGE